METNKDLNEKKWNNEQNADKTKEVNEGFSGENIPDDYDPSSLQKEKETDKEGNTTTVDRARDTDEKLQKEKGWDDNESLSRNSNHSAIDSEELVENKDYNYDTDPDRYTDVSNPENKKDRGNIKLDE